MANFMYSMLLISVQMKVYFFLGTKMSTGSSPRMNWEYFIAFVSLLHYPNEGLSAINSFFSGIALGLNVL